MHIMHQMGIGFGLSIKSVGIPSIQRFKLQLARQIARQKTKKAECALCTTADCENGLVSFCFALFIYFGASGRNI